MFWFQIQAGIGGAISPLTIYNDIKTEGESAWDRNQESLSTTQPNLSWEWLLIGLSTHTQNSWGTDADDFVINMKWGGVVSNLKRYLTATFACRWSEKKKSFSDQKRS